MKEICIQLVNAKHHQIIIMWAHVCIILHNLIICIEGDNFNEDWREQIRETNLDRDDAYGDVDEDDGLEDMLEQAQRRLETPRQHFRLKLMDNLFNSPSCAAEHRP